MYERYIKNCKIVTVDFDHTLTTDGKTISRKVCKYINKINELGLELVLWTCRLDKRYQFAVDTIKRYNLPIKCMSTLDDVPRKPVTLFSIDDRSVVGGKINWYKTYRWIKKLKKREVTD